MPLTKATSLFGFCEFPKGISSNTWLAQNLHMGVLYGVSRYVKELRSGRRPEAEKLYRHLNAKIKE